MPLSAVDSVCSRVSFLTLLKNDEESVQIKVGTIFDPATFYVRRMTRSEEILQLEEVITITSLDRGLAFLKCTNRGVPFITAGLDDSLRISGPPSRPLRRGVRRRRGVQDGLRLEEGRDHHEAGDRPPGGRPLRQDAAHRRGRRDGRRHQLQRLSATAAVEDVQV